MAGKRIVYYCHGLTAAGIGLGAGGMSVNPCRSGLPLLSKRKPCRSAFPLATQRRPCCSLQRKLGRVVAGHVFPFFQARVGQEKLHLHGYNQLKILGLSHLISRFSEKLSKIGE